MISQENIERYEKILESSGTVIIALDEFSNEFIKIFLRSDGDYDITHWKDCVGYFWEHGSGDKCYEHGYSCTDSVVDKLMPDGTKICVKLSSYVEEDSAVCTGNAIDAVRWFLS